MTRRKKIFLAALLLLVMLSITFVNIRGTLLSYYSFYHTRDQALHNKVYTRLGFVEDWRPYSLFLTYTGFETGYGFFAPNVASDFIIDFECSDRSGKPMDMRRQPLLMHTKEGRLRLNTACSMFLCYATPDTASLDKEKCRIFLKGMCMRILEDNPEMSAITGRVYLYHHPFLKDLEKSKSVNPRYILYESATYSRQIVGAW